MVSVFIVLSLGVIALIFCSAFSGGRMRRWCVCLSCCLVSSLVTLALSVSRHGRDGGVDRWMPADTVEVYGCIDGRALLVLAMMSVESGFNPMAEGSDGDTGVLQIRRIYVDEVNRILGYTEYNLLDAFDVDRSLEMFDILQGRHNPDGDMEKTIYYHNKSSAYKDRVIKEYNRLLLYERMRERVANRY